MEESADTIWIPMIPQFSNKKQQSDILLKQNELLGEMVMQHCQRTFKCWCLAFLCLFIDVLDGRRREKWDDRKGHCTHEEKPGLTTEAPVVRSCDCALRSTWHTCPEPESGVQVQRWTHWMPWCHLGGNPETYTDKVYSLRLFACDNSSICT